MIQAKGHAAQNSALGLAPFTFERKEPREKEVLIDILYCGICHADIYQCKNEYSGTQYPFVPRHEIIGRAKAYCAKHGITADVEVISPDYINIAYERILNSDVKYRFVMDMSTL